MSNLYAGSILKIDLSSDEISKEPTNSYSRSYLGGRGINARLIYDNVPPGADALGPDNALAVGVGPLGGTSISTARTELTAKSPETGLLGSSNFGGFFGAEIKFAGYDNIVITGKAEKPVYIWIDNGRVEIRDASAAWGKDSYESPGVIRREIGNPEAKIACIGQAGEHLVRFASVQHEQGHGAGRTGMGAVMGSKNLKAIAVRGTNGLKLADPEAFLAAAGRAEKALKTGELSALYPAMGNARAQDMLLRQVYPALSRSMLGTGDDISPESLPDMAAIAEKHAPKRAGCFGCPVQCMDQYDDVEGIGSGTISCMLYIDLHYCCRCYDADAVLKGGVLCQRYGMDVTSTTQMIRWLMELYEEGVINRADTDGVAMEWGSPEAILTTIEKIAHREGIGDVLAESSLRAAEKIGRGSIDYVNHVKGLPIYGEQNPNNMAAFKAACLSASVSPRGDTRKGMHFPVEQYEEVEDPEKLPEERKRGLAQCYEGSAEAVANKEDVALVCDMLSVCRYTITWMQALTLEHAADLYSAGSGMATSVEALVEQAWKIRSLERAVDVREGLTREAETPPERYFNKGEPIKEGPYKGNVLDSQRFEEMKTEYYEVRGWDPVTGVPTEETLKKLGLEDVARDLEKLGNSPASGRH